MKRTSLFLIAFLLFFCPAAYADGNENIEIIKMDGVSVIMLTPEETLFSKGMFATNSIATSDFALPRALTVIGEEAFAGVSATQIEVSENVVSIGRNAFADCGNLRAIIIPATVLSIDDTALSGCENVIVYGKRDSEAERFAAAAGFVFIDQSPDPIDLPSGKEQPPVVLPFVPTN